MTHGVFKGNGVVLGKEEILNSEWGGIWYILDIQNWMLQIHGLENANCYDWASEHFQGVQLLWGVYR